MVLSSLSFAIPCTSAYSLRTFVRRRQLFSFPVLKQSVNFLSHSAPTRNPVRLLREKADTDPHLAAAITKSLRLAKSQAQRQLKPVLLEALAWPETLEEYLAYLETFLKYIPQQHANPAWKIPGHEGHHREVYDRLCHFYWLIAQHYEGKKMVQEIPWFRDWLVSFSKAWGEFLDTPGSFNEEILASFQKYSPAYRVEDSMIDGKPNNPSGWLTFNQFFARRLNPGLRPIAFPWDNSIVTSPADCTFKAMYSIDAQSRIPAIRIKHTHRYATIDKLLAGSQFAQSFANGKFVHYFLGPYSYHRFHTPVAGLVKESYRVQEQVYLDIGIAENGQFEAPDRSEGGYEFAQTRGILILDTKDSPEGDIGLVAVITVGMSQVSSVNLIATPGTSMVKGEEFGYFMFGGSDIIVLFQEKAKALIDGGGDYRLYGTPIASCLHPPSSE